MQGSTPTNSPKQPEGTLELLEDEAFILVKAAPRHSQTFGETVCCAGIDRNGAWVRLYASRITEEVRNSSAFKALNKLDFRTRAARDLRDARLTGRTMGFIHQASGYRGKANYREALFLAYGTRIEPTLQGFLSDQALVLRAFLAMAGAFASRKLGKVLWDEFVDDVDANRAFSTTAASVWA